MIIKTKYFGDINVDENKVILFDDGVLGFPDLKKYLFMESDDDANPICWLQSIDDIDITFPIMDVSSFISDYSPIVDNSEIEVLGEADDEDLAIYNIVVIPKNIEELSVNLKAPVVINLNTLKAKQVISNNENHQIKFYLYKELKQLKAGE